MTRFLKLLRHSKAIIRLQTDPESLENLVTPLLISLMAGMVLIAVI